jgi:hypothetical protein
LKNPISSLKEKITQYIQLRFELIRLEVVERLVSVMGYFAYIIIAIFLFFTAVFFICLGLAEMFSSIFNSKTAGYFCVAGLVLIASLIVALSSKKIVRFFAGKMVWLLTKKKEKQEEGEDEGKA